MMLIPMITLMISLMISLMMMILMILMMDMPYDYVDCTDDDNVHKNDSYTAAGAAPGARVPCSLFKYN